MILYAGRLDVASSGRASSTWRDTGRRGTTDQLDRLSAMETLTQSLMGAAAIAGWLAFMGTVLVAARWLK